MLHSKFFRISLLLVIIVSLFLIIISLISRMGGRQEEAVEEILPVEVIRRTTEFEHTQLKNGKVLFRVIGGSSTMKSNGDNVLERVSLWRFGESGEPSDMIEGEQAVYNPEKKEILFAGDVVIRLQVGILIYADEARGDLEKEILVIPGDYQMEHESVVGRGKGLEYVFTARRIKFLDNFGMVMDALSERKELSAGKGEYLIDSGMITLEDGAAVEGPQISLSGRRIIVSLDEEGKLSMVRAWEDARLLSGESQSFSGNHLVLDIFGTSLEVHGGAGRQAVYASSQAESTRQIAADRILCSFLSTDTESWEFESIRAEGDVGLRLSESGIDECRSELFVGAVSSEEGRGFEEIELRGDVFLTRRNVSGGRESLRAGIVSIEMDGREKLERVLAQNSILVEIESGVSEERRGFRRLEVDDFLRINYRDGVIQSAEGGVGCRMRSVYGVQEEEIESDRVTMVFAEGLLSRVAAAGNVRGSSRNEGVERSLSCASLEVDYGKGLFTGFRQSGGAVIRQNENGRIIEVRSRRNDYDLSSQILTAEGGEPLLLITERDEEGLQKFETRAKKILVGSGDGSVEAEGEVESIYNLQDSNLIFVSSSMKNDPDRGVVEYSGDARLLLEGNVIRGEKMVLERDTRNLFVSGGVDTQLVAAGEAGSEEYRIRSNELELATEKGTATYREDVRMDSEDLEIEAPTLVLYMDSGQMKEFSRIEAWGGVRIMEEGRLWTGEKATYLKETGKVTVDGR